MSARGTRRSNFTARRGGGKLGNVKFWLKRSGIVLAACIGLIWIGAWLFLSGSIAKAGEWTKGEAIHITSLMGMNVENILVEGRDHTDPAVILAIVNTQKGDPIFGFDPATAREQIEKISWVKSAQVERRLPGTIYVRLTERQPLALWQHDRKLSLIDKEGQVLTDSNLAPYKNLVMVVGSNAPIHAAELLQILAAEPTINKNVESAAWVGDRRWDVSLKNGITVRLPEEDMGLGLKRLAQAESDDGILEKDITEVDLREADRLVVRTRPGNVQEYKASLKGGKEI